MGDPDREGAATVVERPGSQPERTPAVPSPPLAEAPSAFDPPSDRFEVQGELGRGGMGRVDEAYDRALGRAVAIKHMLTPNATDLARFEREARITARLEHPGIVPIHDAGRTPEGTPYYVMRRVDGRPLSEVAAGKTLDERLALVPNVLAACDAAGFAHARGIVHRDIKPTNILIGPFGETLLIDWGLAREIGSGSGGDAVAMPSEPDLTRAGTVAGTPGFMSPEQARGEAVDARADVFALGATLFYVLSGQLPWHASGGTEMIAHVGANRPADWRLLPAEVPADLRAVLEKAMAPDSAARYPDASAFAGDLRRFITGNLVGAYTYGRMARIVRFIKRNRALVGVAAASLVVIAVIATLSVRRVIAERDGANAARALAEQRQREATDLADGRLVENARQLADTDPVAAIAKLRTLSPTSTKWREAWAAASAAWIHGVPFGFVGEVEPGVLHIAGDSRHALVLSYSSGTLAVVDFIDRTRRVVANLGRAFNAEWLGTSVVALTSENVLVVDTNTGKITHIPIQATNIVGNRTDRLLMRAKDGRVLEMTTANMTPREIAHGVDEMDASPDLSSITYQRGNAREIVVRGRSFPVPVPTDDRVFTVVIRDDVLAFLTESSVRTFSIDDDGLHPRDMWPRNTLLFGIGVAGGQVYQVDTNGLSIVNSKGFRSDLVRATFSSFFHTPRGFVLVGQDGEISGMDDSGYFELSRRPSAYRIVQQSDDGRFVAAMTTMGEILVWDLHAVRGRAVYMDSGLTPLEITGTSVYATDNYGFGRVDMETEKFTMLMTPKQTDLSRYIVDMDERWTVRFGPDKSLEVYDIPHRRVVPLADRDVTAWAFGEQGLVYVRRDGVVRLWRTGSEDPGETLTTVRGEATVVAIRPEWLLVVINDTEVLRIDRATGVSERTAIEQKVEQVAIDTNGRAWLLCEDGSLRHWESGLPIALPFETPERIDYLLPAAGGVLMHGSKSMIVTDPIGHARVIPVTSDNFDPMSDTLAATARGNGSVSIVDVATGSSFELPHRMVQRTLTANGTRIGFMTGLDRSGRWRFEYWDLAVPRDPAALQKWLTTITNARVVPDSDAVAWPDR